MRLFVIIAFALKLTGTVFSANVLVYPYGHCFNSHLVQMEKLAGVISENGHSVKMLINDNYKKPHFRGTTNLGKVNLIQFEAPENVTTFCDFKTIEAVTQNVMKYIKAFTEVAYLNCENILKNKIVLKQLKDNKFDMMMIDALDVCGLVLVNYLNIPYISFVSQGLGSTSDVDAPIPLAYVPSMMSESTHKMTFFERMQNFFFHTFQSLHFHYLMYQYQKLQDKYVDVPHSLYSAHQRPSLRLLPGHFPFDYPKPIMPDMVMIGDFFISKPRTLSSDLETFMDLADDGVVIVSFGTQIREYTDKYGDMFAEALGRLSQKVIWRYVGEPPAALKNNTKLLSYIPQTDLLAHHKTALFITHCGRGSSYEAAYYGIPVLAIPMTADQPSQAARLTRHLEMGIKLDIRTATAETLYQAIHHVLSESRYKDNSRQISSMLRNQPQDISDRDKILKWVDYIARHNGAYHYKSQALNLCWYQLMMLDVLCFIIIVAFLTVFVLRRLYKIVFSKSLAFYVYALKEKTL